MGIVKGQLSYEKWKDGKKLTRKTAIEAHCYECNGFEDSSEDCRGEESCALYVFSPSGMRNGKR